MRVFFAAWALGASLVSIGQARAEPAPGEVPPAKGTAPVPAAVSAAPQPPKSATPRLSVRIDLTTQRMQLAYDGRQQERWEISSGAEGHATPRGVFRPQWTAKLWLSKKYDNAPMPHAVFFNGGVAVHGTQSVGMLGQPASHGCVRLAPGNAHRFYDLVHKHGLANTRIEVFGTPPPSRVAKRNVVPAQTRLAAAAASDSGWGWDWGGQASAPSRGHSKPQLGDGQRRPLVHLAPNSPYRGRASFVLNGVTYVRVR